MKRAFDAFENPVGAGMQEVSPGVYEITGVPAGKYSVQTQNPQTGQMSESTEINLSSSTAVAATKKPTSTSTSRSPIASSATARITSGK